MSYNGQYSDTWSGTVAQSNATSPTSLEYAFDLRPGSGMVPGSWRFVGSWNGTGALHVAAGDTWTVTTTFSGVTRTLSGTF